MAINFPYKQDKVTIALKLDGYYVWDASVIKAKGKYWMFASRWKYELGFGWNWLYHSEIVLTCSDKPEGPYEFVKVVLPRRGKEYFDGMNTHNPCIKYYDGKYYLYYMGCTYDYEPPKHMSSITQDMAYDLWNYKRIGLAIADEIDGEYIRFDKPILEPRLAPFWDRKAITNPSVIIKEDGSTYMIYKSRTDDLIIPGSLQLGITKADKPDGKYERIVDYPILQFDDGDLDMEDPHIWFDKKRNKYCVIAKECNAKITPEYGTIFYAESDDCMNFKYFKEDPIVATRYLTWDDGHKTHQCNLERPWLLFDENGEPTHLFCASGNGESPYQFEGHTYVVCIKLVKSCK